MFTSTSVIFAEKLSLQLDLQLVPVNRNPTNQIKTLQPWVSDASGTAPAILGLPADEYAISAEESTENENVVKRVLG